MPTRIAASKPHQSQRLAYQPRGVSLESIERSHSWVSGALRANMSGPTRVTMLASRTKAIAEGLIAAIQRIEPINEIAGRRVDLTGRGELRTIIKTREISA